jgi:hypothetical protein
LAGNPLKPSKPKPICANCRFFVNDPEAFERALPGILILSSGQGHTRGDQGLCEVHDKMLMPSMGCARFDPCSESSQ